jgi:hypothetical protein
LLAGYLLSVLFLSSLRWPITATLDASLDHLVGGQYDDPRMFTLAFGVAGEITIEDFGRFNGLLKTLRYAEVDDAFSALTVRTANAGLWQSWLTANPDMGRSTNSADNPMVPHRRLGDGRI